MIVRVSNLDSPPSADTEGNLILANNRYVTLGLSDSAPCRWRYLNIKPPFFIASGEAPEVSGCPSGLPAAELGSVQKQG